MLSEDIIFLPVSELSRRIQKRQLSPVELTQSYLERSRTLGPRLNAYVTLTDQLALQQAHTAEKEIAAGKYRGALHGIPYAAKDLLAVKGYPTTWGARPYADQKFDFDATVIRKLEAAGAVLIGKAAMIELAGGMGYRYASASATGPAKNPWNTNCWTCGSSSGSGAIVAAGLAAFAIGTETWGSIVCPSGFNGVSGLRPTFGRVSKYGAMALAYSMDKIGPMCRSAQDCDLVLKSIAGHDPKDDGSLPDPAAQYSGVVRNNTPLRLGWITNAWKEISPEIADVITAAHKVLDSERSVTLKNVDLPQGPWEEAAGVTVSVEGATAFRSLIESGRVAELNDPAGKIGGYINEEISASDYMLAQRIRGILQKKMDEVFAQADVLVTATLPVTATTLDANLDDALSFPDPVGGIGNFCGLPAISVPCGFSKNGLPAGLQFIARPLDDGKAVAAAQLFQSRTDWHTRHPRLA